MFEIYQVKLTQFGEPAYVFLTAYHNPGGFLRAETFCVFPAPNLTTTANRLKCEFRHFEDCATEFNMAMMLELAMDEAQIVIKEHLSTYYSGMQGLFSKEQGSIIKVDLKPLARLQLRGSLDFAVEIARNTECDELRLELQQIMKLPIVTSKPIPLE